MSRSSYWRGPIFVAFFLVSACSDVAIAPPGSMLDASHDASSIDMAIIDQDAARIDAPSADAELADAQVDDAQMADAGDADAGNTDAGNTDAGDADAGNADAGDLDASVDAGHSDLDLGFDSGLVDLDFGVIDIDGGVIEVDLGHVEIDAGAIDSGAIDAGTVDVDAGEVEVDAGPIGPPTAFDVAHTTSLAGPAASDFFARAIAISLDGNVLAVSDPGFGGDGLGAVHLYVRGEDGWPSAPNSTIRGPALTSSFATSIALSPDGSTVAVGDYGYGGAPDYEGGVHLFTRIGPIWGATPVQTLVGPDDDSGTFGDAVAFSSDGETLLVGDGEYRPPSGFRRGGVHFFARSGAAWATTPYETIAAPSDGRYFGSAIALSQDGQMLVVGDRAANSSAGLVFVYVRGASGWPSEPTQTITPIDGTHEFGVSVAISPDKLTLAVGDLDFVDAGNDRVFLYGRDGVRWASSHFQSILASSIEVAGTYFAIGLCFDPSGEALIVGAPDYGLPTRYGRVYFIPAY